MDESRIRKEIKCKGSRSGGPGGQHANKVSTRITAQFDLHASEAITGEEKMRIAEKLKHRINDKGILTLSCDSSRSQHQNRSMAIERMITLLRGALKRPRKRVPTKISVKKKLKRLESKSKHSEKKALRRPPKLD